MARLWTRVAAAAVLACAQDLACVRTPASYVQRLDATGYQRLDRPGVALMGMNAAPLRRNGTDMWMKDQYLDILFRWLLCRLGVQIGWLRRGLLWLMANGFGIAWFMLMVRGCRRSLRW